MQIGCRLCRRRSGLRRDKAADKMPVARRKGLESRRKTVKHTARRSNARFGLKVKAISACCHADGCRLRRKLSGLRRDKAADKNADTRTKALGNPEKGPRLPIAPLGAKVCSRVGKGVPPRAQRGTSGLAKVGFPGPSGRYVPDGSPAQALQATYVFLHGGY